jgi:hypothetical protein
MYKLRDTATHALRSFFRSLQLSGAGCIFLAVIKSCSRHPRKRKQFLGGSGLASCLSSDWRLTPPESRTIKMTVKPEGRLRAKFLAGLLEMTKKEESEVTRGRGRRKEEEG